ncbi:MAG TPA: DUF2092 domain-containing protein [Pyrinomonadaceae bacterium]|nr:DUF2092 domain-containing protein [Pyrinomonadaceae bacterium]
MKTTSRSLLLIAILSFAWPAMAQPQRKPDPQRILDNMFRVYSGLKSYQDEGIVIETRDEPTGGTIEKLPFKTSFKRPNFFRFEWTDYGITKLGRTHIVWSNGNEAFTYWEPDRYEKTESLGLAVAGASGVSSGAARTVSSMLITEEIGGVTWKRLEKVSLVGEEVVDGVRCYHVKAISGDEPLELWIGKADFLLRKHRQERKLDEDLYITEEFRRKIQVDHSIPDLAFNYQPPIALTPRNDITSEQIDRLLNPGPPVWTEFRSEVGRFSVMMPEKPTSQASAFETPQGRFEQHAFTAAHSWLICVLSYTDFPKETLVANDVEGMLETTRDQFIKQLDGKLESETSLSLDGHPGREVKVNMFRGKARFRLFLVNYRLYVLLATTLDNSSESDEDEKFNKFFTSFKLTPIAKPIAALKAPRNSLYTRP